MSFPGDTRSNDEVATSRKAWKEAPIAIDGSELKILDREVMQAWEAPYMLELARIAVSRGGRVLEVGFGMGISAKYIHELAAAQGVVEHVIVEANAAVFARLESFAAQWSTATFKITPILGFWEEVVDKFEPESFDGVLFDPYPIDWAEQSDKSYHFVFAAHRLLKPQGRLTYYSNEAKEFSDWHKGRIHAAGFTSIEQKVCEVPGLQMGGSEYWNKPSMLVPILTKQ